MPKELIQSAVKEVDDGLVTGNFTYDGDYYVSGVTVVFNDLVTHRTAFASKHEDIARDRFNSDLRSASLMAESTAFLISLAVDRATRIARAEGRAEAEMGAA